MQRFLGFDASRRIWALGVVGAIAAVLVFVWLVFVPHSDGGGRTTDADAGETVGASAELRNAIGPSAELDATLFEGSYECGVALLCGQTDQPTRAATFLMAKALTTAGARETAYMKYYEAVNPTDLGRPSCNRNNHARECFFDTALDSLPVHVMVVETESGGSRFDLVRSEWPAIPAGVADPLFSDGPDSGGTSIDPGTREVIQLVAAHELPAAMRSVPLEVSSSCGVVIRCVHSALAPQGTVRPATAYLEQLGAKRVGLSACSDDITQFPRCSMTGFINGRLVSIDVGTNVVETKHGTRPYGSTLYVTVSGPPQ